MGKATYILFIIGLLVSCKQADKFSEARKIYEESIKIHDELMPQMMEINKTLQNLKLRRDSVSDAVIQQDIDSLISSLNLQHDKMRDWMRNMPQMPGDEYPGMERSADNREIKPEELLKMQLASLEKIKDLQTGLNESMTKTKKILNEPLN